jgi:hypothetical protein
MSEPRAYLENYHREHRGQEGRTRDQRVAEGYRPDERWERLATPSATLTPVEVARRSGIEPDAWQADVQLSRARQALLLCSRQSGKSTTTAILAAHQAVAVPGSLTLLVSPSLRQSGEIYHKVRAVLTALGDLAPVALQETATTLHLANGSRVVSLPGSKRPIVYPHTRGVDLAPETMFKLYNGSPPHAWS